MPNIVIDCNGTAMSYRRNDEERTKSLKAKGGEEMGGRWEWNGKEKNERQ
jgi:hypothetical protein